MSLIPFALAQSWTIGRHSLLIRSIMWRNSFTFKISAASLEIFLEIIFKSLEKSCDLRFIVQYFRDEHFLDIKSQHNAFCITRSNMLKRLKYVWEHCIVYSNISVFDHQIRRIQFKQTKCLRNIPSIQSLALIIIQNRSDGSNRMYQKYSLNDFQNICQNLLMLYRGESFALLTWTLSHQIQ